MRIVLTGRRVSLLRPSKAFAAARRTRSHGHARLRGLRRRPPDRRSRDGSVSVRLADRAVECLSVVSGGEGHASEDLDDARVLAGTFDAGLFRSTDDGESFERVAAESLGPGGSGPDAVTAVATSPHDPAVVWIGTEPSRVYRSTDGGETVQRIGG